MRAPITRAAAPHVFTTPLSGASAEHLDALANELENEAARLRTAASEARRRLSDAASARRARERSRTEFRLIGARVVVLERFYGRAEAERLVVAWSGLTREIVKTAAGHWRKEKTARRAAKRNAEIFRATIRGEKQTAIAQRFGITARRVREIMAQAETDHRFKPSAIFSAERPTT